MTEKDIWRLYEVAAEINDTTVEDVRAEIQRMIIKEMNSGPRAREEWDKIPHKGEEITPEEWLLYLAQQDTDR